MILPEGIKEDLANGLERLAEKYGVSIVVSNDVNWNDDLTPWPAEGVFKKAKPFGGLATSFLDKLTNEIIPEAEKSLGLEEAERTIMGVSLSGLFAVWSGFNTNAFANIISISGSLWYEGFVEWMKEQLENSESKITLVPLAPMTNIAKLMTFYPDLVEKKVDRIVCMGGGYKFGNSTGAAELNIYADPEAAQAVFSFGIPIVMCGLDVCHNAFITKEDYYNVLKSDKNMAFAFISQICEASFAFEEREDIDERFKLWKRPGAIVYDTVPIIYLLHPELFNTLPASISVECESEFCDGMTVCNVSPRSEEPKIHTLVLDVDREGYINAMKSILDNSSI